MGKLSFKEFMKHYFTALVLGIAIIIIGAATGKQEGLIVGLEGGVILLVSGLPLAFAVAWYLSKKQNANRP